MKVTSSCVVDAMVSSCATSYQRRFLQELGMSVGIRRWSDDVATMWEDAKERDRKERKRGRDEFDDYSASSLRAKVIN